MREKSIPLSYAITLLLFEDNSEFKGVFVIGVNNLSCVERRENDNDGVGVVAVEEFVGVINELESTEFDLTSHFSAISLMFLTDGVTVPLPGDILLFDWPLNEDEKDKSRGLSRDLLPSIRLFLSLFIANWAILFFVSPDCMTILFPLLSMVDDHFFSKVDHFLFSSKTCGFVGVETFDLFSL